MNSMLTIGAIGDISFHGRHASTPDASLLHAASSHFAECTLVVGNLEGPLARRGEAVPGKCALRAVPGWAPVLKAGGVGLVSLANNHMMDFGPVGLFETMEVLRTADLAFVGAGRNRQEALAPVFLDLEGRRVAFLGRSSVPVSSACYAGDETPGVAWLDEAETVAALRSCRSRADMVVLIVHWGIEEYRYPSPEQRAQAQRLQAAGADLILGHHPHVLQGVEENPRGVIAYSLGNFLFDEFDWTFEYPGRPAQKLFSALSEENREGLILITRWAAGRRPSTECRCSRITANNSVAMDLSPRRKAEMAGLSRRLKMPFYGPLWRLHSLRMEWNLRLRSKLSPRRILGNLHKLRPSHFRDLAGMLKRSSRLTSGRSTNPYE